MGFFPNGSVGTITGTGGVVSPGGDEPTFGHAKYFLLGAAFRADMYAASQADQPAVTGG